MGEDKWLDRLRRAVGEPEAPPEAAPKPATGPGAGAGSDAGRSPGPASWPTPGGRARTPVRSDPDGTPAGGPAPAATDERTELEERLARVERLLEVDHDQLAEAVVAAWTDHLGRHLDAHADLLTRLAERVDAVGARLDALDAQLATTTGAPAPPAADDVSPLTLRRTLDRIAGHVQHLDRRVDAVAASVAGGPTLAALADEVRLLRRTLVGPE